MKEIESWQNWKWIPNSQIGIKAWDAHFFFGYAVFDAFRTYNHKPHMLDCHIDRFYRSAKLTSINIPIVKKDLIKKVYDVMEHNKEFFPADEEFRFMIFCSPGFFGIYKDMGKIEPTLTIDVTTVSRYAKFIAPYLQTGCIGMIATQPQIPSRFLDSKIKSCSRLHYGIADAEAATHEGNVWPILLDEHGFMAESSGANFGFIKDGRVCLPKDENVLNGCTMKFIEERVIENMDIVKDNWSPYDIINSDAAFFTSTFLGLVPCYKIIYQNKEYRLRQQLDIIDIMMEKYSQALGFDVNKQWLDWNEKQGL